MRAIRKFIKRLPGANRAYDEVLNIARALRLRVSSPERVFDEIYRKGKWGGKESISGPGSDRVQTKVVEEELPVIIKKFQIHSLLDIPCGDWNWMKNVELKNVSYFGADIVTSLVENNQTQFGSASRNFICLNLLEDELPKVDLVFCRDCLVHLSNADIRRALRNIVKSGSTYLLTTTFTDRTRNTNIPTGLWRALNLERAPFELPTPSLIVNENCSESGGRYRDKSLGLWEIADLKAIVS